MEIWENENLKKWKFGKWKFGKIELCNNGISELWKFRKIEIR